MQRLRIKEPFCQLRRIHRILWDAKAVSWDCKAAFGNSIGCCGSDSLRMVLCFEVILIHHANPLAEPELPVQSNISVWRMVAREAALKLTQDPSHEMPCSSPFAV